MAVWEDQLLPLLTCKEAARLGCTCKALRGVVREHFKGGLGEISLKELKAALTTFPRTRSVTPRERDPGVLTATERGELVEGLWAGHGRDALGITTMIARSGHEEEEDEEAANTLVHAALRGGALPSLKGVGADLCIESQRASLTVGFLGRMHELRLKVVCTGELGRLSYARRTSG
jgi:hypothetical protein